MLVVLAISQAMSLDKALAGKQAGVSFTLSPFNHGLKGNSTPKDIETLMQAHLSQDDRSKQGPEEPSTI